MLFQIRELLVTHGAHVPEPCVERSGIMLRKMYEKQRYDTAVYPAIVLSISVLACLLGYFYHYPALVFAGSFISILLTACMMILYRGFDENMKSAEEVEHEDYKEQARKKMSTPQGKLLKAIRTNDHVDQKAKILIEIIYAYLPKVGEEFINEQLRRQTGGLRLVTKRTWDRKRFVPKLIKVTLELQHNNHVVAHHDLIK